MSKITFRETLCSQKVGKRAISVLTNMQQC